MALEELQHDEHIVEEFILGSKTAPDHTFLTFEVLVGELQRIIDILDDVFSVSPTDLTPVVVYNPVVGDAYVSEIFQEYSIMRNFMLTCDTQCVLSVFITSPKLLGGTLTVYEGHIAPGTVIEMSDCAQEIPAGGTINVSYLSGTQPTIITLLADIRPFKLLTSNMYRIRRL